MAGQDMEDRSVRLTHCRVPAGNLPGTVMQDRLSGPARRIGQRWRATRAPRRRVYGGDGPGSVAGLPALSAGTPKSDKRNSGRRKSPGFCSHPSDGWIPACAGMTRWRGSHYTWSASEALRDADEVEAWRRVLDRDGLDLRESLCVQVVGIADGFEHLLVGGLFAESADRRVHDEDERIVEVQHLQNVLCEVHPQVVPLDVGQLMEQHVAKMSRPERGREVAGHDDDGSKQAANGRPGARGTNLQTDRTLNAHALAAVKQDIIHQVICRGNAVETPAGSHGPAQQHDAYRGGAGQPKQEDSPLPGKGTQNTTCRVWEPGSAWPLPYPAQGGLGGSRRAI